MSKKKIAFLSISVALMLSLIGGALFGQSSPKNNVFRYLSIFTEVFDLVRNNYVEAVPSDQLLDGAFNGVTDAVDEFSFYVPPTQMAAYKAFEDVDDNGVGLVVTKRFGYGYVIAPVAGSPAAKAGIERGDFIEKVDGQPTQKMAVWQIRNALRSNRPVQLQVLRGGQTKRDTFTIQAATFHPVAISTQQFDSVEVIRVPFWEKGSAAQLHAALENARKAGTKKMIIDVRGNAGGDINEAITAADDLLSGGVITSIEGRRIEPRRWTADKATSYDGDLEVLTDASTAAGAEIFASAIHGNNRGKTVGVTTYGKSIVQKWVPLSSGGGVYMTIAHYTTPELKPIKDGGVKPDVVVDLTANALRERIPGEQNQPEDDLILERALEMFNEKVVVKKAA